MDQNFHKRIWLTFFAVIFISFLYRFWGITISHPFWVDEFSSANQARLIIEQGINIFNNPNVIFDSYHVGYHFILASFFKAFGESEFIARMPSVLIGTLIPGMVLLLGNRVLNFTAGLYGALLSISSYFLITWSRQSRGYVFLQFYILATLYLYFEISKDSSRSPVKVALFFIFIAMGLLTHSLFYIYAISLLLHFILIHSKKLMMWIKKPLFFIFIAVVCTVSYVSGFIPSLMGTYWIGNIIQANNVWYYHSFLWREYPLVTYMALLGYIMLLFKKNSLIPFVSIYFLLHLVFINFLFAPYVSRYLLVLWPIILLLMGYCISNISSYVTKNTPLNSAIMGLFLVGFIVINGDKFVFKPKPFYSVNHDFREIALIDYHQIYDLIKDTGDLDKGQTAIIDTWHDRIYWYVGRNYKASYLFRWQDETETTNGLLHKTVIKFNTSGEKVLPKQGKLRFIGTLDDLKVAISRYPKGFIIIDDSSLPQDVITYVLVNFKKRLHLDHYQLDDNPYSIWPTTLYSWGFE